MSDSVNSTSIFDDERKRRLLDWLLAPAELRAEHGWPSSQRGVAAWLGVSPRTIRDWQANPQFRAEWDKESKDIIGDPARIQRILEALEVEALDPNSKKQVQAAKVFLDVVEAIRPPALDMARKRAAEMTDAELDAMIAEAALAEKAARR